MLAGLLINVFEALIFSRPPRSGTVAEDDIDSIEEQ